MNPSAASNTRTTFRPKRSANSKLPSALDGRLADLAKRRGVPKSVLVREAIEAKIAEEAAAPRRRPANLIEALGDSVGSIASGKRDLAPAPEGRRNVVS